MGKWSSPWTSIQEEIRDNQHPPRNGLPVDPGEHRDFIVVAPETAEASRKADRPVYCNCPECGGTGGDCGGWDETPDPVCERCRGNGSVRESELTPAEAEAARKGREEDDRWRNKVDYGRD